ncbi:MAG: NmrA family NAD(P)-binding protein [Candidatus Eisenbacteria bacterium]|uniref:NmrA family NAD(P)-binding protein n=1 Tax=Eiseniibacteriota bacterium TaxID=2212470 RepID=A0A849SF14_UNCEI|nr:NmrA family NAD(P)-binding protein [Candidatus Eisenbacteria bacterium]
MKYLVLGATGTVGSQVARELMKQGATVRVLTRNPEKAAALGPNVETVKGNLLDPASLEGLFKGVDGAFLLNAVGSTECQEGLMAVSAAITQKLARIVYLSVQHADRASYLPHFGSKIGVEHAIERSGIPFTILRPSNFHQNDQWFKDVMLQYGVYPQPLGGTGVSRVDVRDIGEAAAIALTQNGHQGKTYDLVGPRGMTGIETASIWSKALGREIRYGGDDLDAWEKANAPYLSAPMLYDFRLMYLHFQTRGLLATADEVATLTRVLGHAPRDFESFADETAKAWMAASATR